MRARTRVNAEQASKSLMRKPTRRCIGEGRRRIGKRATQAPNRFRRGIGAGTHGRGGEQQHGKPCRWRARTKPESRKGQAWPGRVAERSVLPGRPGNAGGGKGPQVRRGEGKREGHREWHCLEPRHCVSERAGTIACESEGCCRSLYFAWGFSDYFCGCQ